MTENKPNPGPILHVYFTRYSSWGVRVALILDYFQIPHTTKGYGWNPAVAPPAHLSGGLLPVLQPDPSDEGFLIGDSLAISEFLAEQHPQLHLWPKDLKLRALARTAAAQMHSGFNVMRNTYHTNFFGKYTGKIPISEAAAKEIRNMVQLWSKARADTKKRLQELGEKDEGFLFGAFSIADAFFWPVLWRFRSYQLPLTGISEDGLKWVAKMWNDPIIKQHSQQYFRQAQNPLTIVEKYENIFRGNPNVEYSQFSEDWTFNPTEA
ncbi:putative glutathione S transferase [Annulohypoxylon moriforme]|nr:putative glutathione S transferase [Annulohypoxylon moriforme]